NLFMRRPRRNGCRPRPGVELRRFVHQSCPHGRVELSQQWSLTMAFFTAASKADFQQQLQAALAQHVDEKRLPQVGLFAEQFFGIVALSELAERRMSDLVGATLASWRLL